MKARTVAAATAITLLAASCSGGTNAGSGAPGANDGGGISTRN